MELTRKVKFHQKVGHTLNKLPEAFVLWWYGVIIFFLLLLLSILWIFLLSFVETFLECLFVLRNLYWHKIVWNLNFSWSFSTYIEVGRLITAIVHFCKKKTEATIDEVNSWITNDPCEYTLLRISDLCWNIIKWANMLSYAVG